MMIFVNKSQRIAKGFTVTINFLSFINRVILRLANYMDQNFFKINKVNTCKFITYFFINFLGNDFFIFIDKTHQKFVFFANVKTHHADFVPASIPKRYITEQITEAVFMRKAFKNTFPIKTFTYHLTISRMDYIHGNKFTGTLQVSFKREKAFKFFLAIKRSKRIPCRIKDKHRFHLLAKLHDNAFVEMAIQFVALF